MVIKKNLKFIANVYVCICAFFVFLEKNNNKI